MTTATDKIQKLIARLKDPDQYTDAVDEAITKLEWISEQTDRLVEMTGHTDDLAEALDQWERERQAMAQFHSENEYLKKVNEKLDGIALGTERLVIAIRKSGGLFLPPALLKLCDEFEEEFKAYRKFLAKYEAFKKGEEKEQTS